LVRAKEAVPTTAASAAALPTAALEMAGLSKEAGRRGVNRDGCFIKVKGHLRVRN
jgi:hypothetical protein